MPVVDLVFPLLGWAVVDGPVALFRSPEVALGWAGVAQALVLAMTTLLPAHAVHVGFALDRIENSRGLPAEGRRLRPLYGWDHAQWGAAPVVV